MGALLPSIFDDAEEEFAASERSLDATARQAPEDATFIVSTGTLALGIIFTITTLTLYAYYYATTFDFTKFAQNKNFSSRKGKSQSYSFTDILENLERAFVKYGLKGEDDGCKRKIVCEALLPDSRRKNQKVADTLSDILNDGFDVSHAYKGAETPEQKRLDLILNAAKIGHKEKSCKKLEKYCEKIHLGTLPPQ